MLGFGTFLILISLVGMILPIIVVSLLIQDGFDIVFIYLKFMLWLLGLSMLPMLLWDKAKKSEFAGLLCVSVSIGEAYSLIKNSDDGTFNFIIMAFAYTFGVLIVLYTTFYVVQLAIKDGRKEFYKDKYEYERLKNTNVDELTSQEKKRLNYLESHKSDFEGEFTPTRIEL